MNRLIISKTSWGIVIFYEIKELLDLSKDANDVQEVLPSIYLKLNDQKYNSAYKNFSNNFLYIKITI